MPRRKRTKSQPKPYRRWIIRGAFGLTATALLWAIAGFILIRAWITTNYAAVLASPETLITNRIQGVTLLDRNGRAFFTFYEPQRRQMVSLKDISSDLKKAVVASEDRDFYQHHGIVWRSIAESVITNVKAGTIARGGSTISQQLVKITLLNPAKSYVRKFQEVILAGELERRFNKDQILEMYLNSAYFGDGAYGIEMAAKTFFGKSAKDLNLAESSLLVGLLPSPSALSPLDGNVERAQARQREVLHAMVNTGAISPETADAAAKQSLTFQTAPEISALNSAAPHFALLVRQQLIDQYGEAALSHSCFTVKTTIDLDEQAFAQKTVADQVKLLEKHTVSNGAAVIEDVKTGEILALVGSRDWHWPGFGTFNVTTAKRQPGSSFKPFVYSLALDKRLITAATTLHDVPTTYKNSWETYQPHNYDGRYHGNVTVRRALANSFNVPAVEVMNKLTTGDVVNWAKNLGITTLDDPKRYGLSLVLGAAEVTPIQITNAYATFADGGHYKDPVTILEVRDKFGRTVETRAGTSRQAVSPQVSFLISSILSDANARREVFGKALTVNRPAAAKTGTTSDYKDAWTLGYTPHRAVGVWVGNNDGTPMDKIAGALGAAPIWRALIEHASKDLPKDSFAAPDGGLTHGLPCTGQGNEWFLTGTEPKRCLPPPPPPEEENGEQSPEQPGEQPATQPTDQSSQQIVPIQLPGQNRNGNQGNNGNQNNPGHQ